MPTLTPNEIEARAADWLAQRDSGHWGASDVTALDAWLAADTRHRVAFLRLQASWAQSDRLQALGAGWSHAGPPPRGYWHAAPADRRAQMLLALRPARASHRPTPRSRGQRLVRAIAMAGCCALLLSWSWRNYTHVDVATYRTAIGEVRTQSLLDGSQATMASNSRIDVRLARTQRDVSLVRGETIFAVAKDPQRPFAVAVGGYRAVAVGTRFSVRRDRDDLRVVVTEGTVRLDAPATAAGAIPSVMLPAGSVALVRGNGLLVRSLPLADAQRLLDWRDGLLAFRDAPLSEVVAEFNRYNARKLVIGDAEAGALRIGGSFRADNATAFVRLIEQGFPVRADASGDRIVLRSR